MPISRDRFRAVCRRRDPERLRAFLAGLHEARGHAVERLPDGHLRVAAPTGTERVAVPGAGESGPAEADRVVVAEPVEDASPRVTDVDALYRQLRYAVDRETARRLLAERLGVEPGGPAGAAPDRPPGGVSLPSSGLAAGVLVFAVACTVFLAGLAVDPAPALTGGSAAGPATAEGTPITPVDPAAPAGAGSAATGAAASGDGTGSVHSLGSGAPAGDQYPRGLSADGITDAWALSAAHRAALADRSYTLRITYRAVGNGTTTARHTEVIRVVNATHYRAEVESVGRFGAGPAVLAGADLYADGETRYARTDGTVRTAPTLSDAPFLPTTRRYLTRWLSVEESEVTAAADGYRVRFEGDRYPAVRNVTGTALVARNGTVRSLRRSYEPSGSGGDREGQRVILTVRLADVGNTTVEEPGWAGLSRRR